MSAVSKFTEPSAADPLARSTAPARAMAAGRHAARRPARAPFAARVRAWWTILVFGFIPTFVFIPATVLQQRRTPMLANHARWCGSL